MKLFVPLWHMPERAVSGGLYRTKRLLETMRAFQLIVADSDTTDVDAQRIAGRVILYPARRLYAFHRRLFRAFRVLNWSWSCLALVAIGLTREQFDAVYAPNSELPHVSLAASIVGKLRRVPIVFGNLNVRGTELWTLNRQLHRNVDAVITLSHALKNELEAEGIGAPIYVGTVGVDDNSVHDIPAPRYDAIYIARHTPEKGALDVIEIVRRCSMRIPALRVAMAGPCSDEMRRKLLAMARECGVDSHIELLGPVSETDKWRLLAASRVCIFPSRVEGWGIVPIEAHLSGLPVVAYDLPAYEETIRHSPGATLVREGDVQKFADALTALVQTPFEGAQAVRRWARQFTWERAARLEEELLTVILRDKAACRRRAPAEG